MSYQYQYSDKISLDWVVKTIPQFLFPDISKKKNRINKLFNGVIATEDQMPVGLILATYGKTRDKARIHTFMVHPNRHSDGIGTELMQRLEKALRSEGCKHLEGNFRSHWKAVPFLTQLLTSAGWSEPVEDLIIVKGEAKKVLRLFMHDKIQLPEDFHFVPFTQLSPGQKEAIKKRKKEENWYSDILDPFTHENTMNPITSMSLVRGDQVVGWVISHQIGPTLNEFTSLFVDESVRSFKMTHLLMRETIMRQDQSGLVDFMITAKADNYAMSRFLIRHAPHTDVFFTKSMYTSKPLV